MAYPSIWTANLPTSREKEAFKDLIGVNNKVLDRLTQICYNMINELEDKSNNFDLPNWELHQASFVGAKKALQRVLFLCGESQDTTTPVS